MAAPFFELQHISKYFARVVANKDVSLQVSRGEVLALLGENGAGKSTVMKILYGLYRADEGAIYKEGAEQKINSPRDAMALGISMIQQHFSLVPAHSVLENIILGNVRGRIDYKQKTAEVEALCRQYGFDIPIGAKIRDLDVGTQQKVEIVKALYLKTSLLIMDEPTAVLTPEEADRLMAFVKAFTAQGNAVIFITHKLKEVMQVADRIIVMQNGQVVGDCKAAATDEAELSHLMIGRDLAQLQKPVQPQGTEPLPVCLLVQNATVQRGSEPPLLQDICFGLRHGEVLGVAGVSGNGQEELCEALCGALPLSSGSIGLNGRDITALTVRQRIDAGIGYVPVDRHRDAMVMDMSLAENMLLKSSFDKNWRRGGFIDRAKLEAYTAKAIAEYDIKAPGPEAEAQGLSGGNQQKVILAREVDRGRELLILNQPTRGLDLGAIHNVHSVVLQQRAAGKAILLISTELSEIFALSDRIAVMYRGAFMGIFEAGALNTKNIGLLMAGYKNGEGEPA